MPSRLAVTIELPPGPNWAVRTASVCPRRTATNWPVRGIPDAGGLVVARRDQQLPVSLKATSLTGPPCPRRTRTSWPSDAAKIRAVPSAAATAIRAPSGLNAAALRGATLSIRRSCRNVSASKIRTALSRPAVTMRVPSVLNAHRGPGCCAHREAVPPVRQAPPRSQALGRPGDEPRTVRTEIDAGHPLTGGVADDREDPEDTPGDGIPGGGFRPLCTGNDLPVAAEDTVYERRRRQPVSCDVLACGVPNTRRSWPELDRQIRRVPSSLAVTTRPASRFNAALFTRSVCPLRTTTFGSAFQTRTVPSELVVTTFLPSSLNAAASTKSLCPRRTARLRPCAGSHSRAVVSPAVTTNLPPD